VGGAFWVTRSPTPPAGAWRAGDHTPRAQVIIALPSSTLALPPAPDATSPLHFDAATGVWSLDVDTAEAARLVTDARGVTVYDGGNPVVATVRTEGETVSGDAAEIMQAVVAELMARGYSESAARRMAGYRGNMPAIGYSPSMRADPLSTAD
jgi:hypothetical protein